MRYVRPEKLMPGSAYLTMSDTMTSPNVLLCLSRRTNGNVTYVTWMCGDKLHEETYFAHEGHFIKAI